jgi:hypothetical protein
MSCSDIGKEFIMYDMYNFPFRISKSFPIITHGGYEYLTYYDYDITKPMRLRFDTDHACVRLVLKVKTKYHIYFNYEPEEFNEGYYDLK